MKRPAKIQWVRLDPEAFLSGCLLMGGGEKTVYAYLLILQAAQGTISAHPEQLALHLDCTVEVVQSVLDEKFSKVEGGWRNPRMQEEILRAEEALSGRQVGAAKSRLLKEKKSRVEEKRVDKANQLGDQTGDQEGDPPPDPPSPLVLPHGPRFADAWAEWTEHRIEIKKPLKPVSTKRSLKTLSALSERLAVEMIHHTVANGWQGLRAPEPPRGQNPNRVAKANPSHAPKNSRYS